MEFYLSFAELAGKISNPVTAVFLPIFLIVTALEAMVIIWRSVHTPGRMRACRFAWHSDTSLPKQQRMG
jgi:hypothetical protein